MKKHSIISLSAVLAMLLVAYAALVGYVYHMASQDTKVKSDAVVVLGEAAMGGTSCFGPRCHHAPAASPHYNVCLESRIDQAVSLYKNHYAAKILMSGGTDPSDGVNEADTMKKIAAADGIPAADILTETTSASTYENLAFSQKVLHNAGLQSAIIVTDPPVNARAGLVASKLHYRYALSPDTRTPCTHFIEYAFREPIGIVYYFLSGRI